MGTTCSVTSTFTSLPVRPAMVRVRGSVAPYFGGAGGASIVARASEGVAGSGPCPRVSVMVEAAQATRPALGAAGAVFGVTTSVAVPENHVAGDAQGA